MSDTRPPCFEPIQWQRWIASARNTGGVMRGGYCTDCTPEYQQKMHAKNLCTNPLVTFETDEHGFLEGVLPCNDPQTHSQTHDSSTDQQQPPTCS